METPEPAGEPRDQKSPVPELRPGGGLLYAVIDCTALVVVFAVLTALAAGPAAIVLNVAIAAVIAPLLALYFGLRRYAPDLPLAAALGLGRPHGRSILLIGLAVLAGAALAPLTAELTRLLLQIWPLPIPSADQAADLRAVEAVPKGIIAVALVAQVAAVPFASELLFRGFIQPRLVTSVGLSRGLAIAVLCSALVQIDLRLVPAALVIGAAAGLLAYRGRSTWAAVAAACAHQLAPLLFALVGAPLTQLDTASLVALPSGLVWGGAAIAAGTIWLAWRLAPVEPSPSAAAASSSVAP